MPSVGMPYYQRERERERERDRERVGERQREREIEEKFDWQKRDWNRDQHVIIMYPYQEITCLISKCHHTDTTKTWNNAYISHYGEANYHNHTHALFFSLSIHGVGFFSCGQLVLVNLYLLEKYTYHYISNWLYSSLIWLCTIQALLCVNIEYFML